MGERKQLDPRKFIPPLSLCPGCLHVVRMSCTKTQIGYLLAEKLATASSASTRGESNFPYGQLGEFRRGGHLPRRENKGGTKMGKKGGKKYHQKQQSRKRLK